MFPPYTSKGVLEGAIPADDYAAIAEDDSRRWKARAMLEASDAAICSLPFHRLQRAKAALRWSGSWYTAQVALDPEHSEDPGAELISEISDYLMPFRRMGHDLLVWPARYVPLSVAVKVCMVTNIARGHVEGVALRRLS